MSAITVLLFMIEKGVIANISNSRLGKHGKFIWLSGDQGDKLALLFLKAL